MIYPCMSIPQPRFHNCFSLAAIRDHSNHDDYAAQRVECGICTAGASGVRTQHAMASAFVTAVCLELRRVLAVHGERLTTDWISQCQ